MRRLATCTLMAGLAAGFMGISFAQGALADEMCFTRSVLVSPDTSFIETPTTIERVVTSPVVIERPATVERIIEKPVTIERVIERPMTVERPLIIQQKEGHHLLNLKLF